MAAPALYSCVQVQSALGPKRRKDQEKFEKHADKKQEKKLRKAAEKKSQKESKAEADGDGIKARRDSSEAKNASKHGKGKGKPGKGKPAAATAADADVSGKSEKPAGDAAVAKKELDRSSRLSSYAVPKLAKPSSGSGGDHAKAAQKKRKAESRAPEAISTENAGLTKAQRKNKKRAEIRASKRSKAE